MTDKKKKALIVCTWDWYYYCHRRTIAKMLIDAGYDVTVVTRIYDHREQIEADGVQILELEFSRPSLNPLREYKIAKQLRKIYIEEKPDLVFHIAFKPVLYGSIAARKLDIPVQVNAIAGMGQLFLGTTLKIKMIRKFVMFALRRLFKNPRTRLIVQNNRDLGYLQKELGLPDERLFLIKGVGVDLNDFQLPPQRNNERPVISLVARLIKEKGVLELVEASRILKAKNLEFEVRLVGDPDFDSPEQINQTELEKWQDDGLIRWVGFQENINQVYADSDIAVLPSYSEGLPKSLLEACACGLPIVTTDNSGCVEVVDDGVNGFIVPVRDAKSLADALESLIVDVDKRKMFGAASRRKAEREFELGEILKQTAQACGVA